LAAGEETKTAKSVGRAMTAPGTGAWEEQSQRLARLTGLLFIVTFVTSIPPVLWFYAPALSDPGFVSAGGYSTGISWGALFELALILANIGSALTLYPVLKRGFPVLSLGYVAARLTECGFIAVGVVSLLALNTLRLNAEGGATDATALQVAGQALVAIHDWTFRLGPGFVVGIGNGLMLGYMMYRSALMPRAIAMLGLIGGPAILASGTAVLFALIPAGGVVQAAATLPEFLCHRDQHPLKMLRRRILPGAPPAHLGPDCHPLCPRLKRVANHRRLCDGCRPCCLG
jgi:hypothetical protein